MCYKVCEGLFLKLLSKTSKLACSHYSQVMNRYVWLFQLFEYNLTNICFWSIQHEHKWLLCIVIRNYYSQHTVDSYQGCWHCSRTSCTSSIFYWTSSHVLVLGIIFTLFKTNLLCPKPYDSLLSCYTKWGSPNFWRPTWGPLVFLYWRAATSFLGPLESSRYSLSLRGFFLSWSKQHVCVHTYRF